jgi:hypothetical protein
MMSHAEFAGVAVDVKPREIAAAQGRGGIGPGNRQRLRGDGHGLGTFIPTGGVRILGTEYSNLYPSGTAPAALVNASDTVPAITSCCLSRYRSLRRCGWTFA